MGYCHKVYNIFNSYRKTTSDQHKSEYIYSYAHLAHYPSAPSHYFVFIKSGGKRSRISNYILNCIHNYMFMVYNEAFQRTFVQTQSKKQFF